MQIKVKVKDKIGYGSKVKFTKVHRDLQRFFTAGGNGGGGQKFSMDKGYKLVSDAYLLFWEDDTGIRKAGWPTIPYNKLTGECWVGRKHWATIQLVKDEDKDKSKV